LFFNSFYCVHAIQDVQSSKPPIVDEVEPEK